MHDSFRFLLDALGPVHPSFAYTAATLAVIQHTKLRGRFKLSPAVIQHSSCNSTSDFEFLACAAVKTNPMVKRLAQIDGADAKYGRRDLGSSKTPTPSGSSSSCLKSDRERRDMLDSNGRARSRKHHGDSINDLRQRVHHQQLNFKERIKHFTWIWFTMTVQNPRFPLLNGASDADTSGPDGNRWRG
nr:hypothetical protein CFP56_21989 [Quercus suber]